MKKLVAIVALLILAPFMLEGCGGCTPVAAYTIPAYWSHSYYSDESEFEYFRTRYSCNYYTDSYGYERRRCSSYLDPVYRYYRQYHPAVYHPTQYVPAVVCPTSKN